MDILEWLHLLSANVRSSNINDCVFILYIITAILIKKSRYLLAFSFSVLLIELSLFDGLQEYQIYLTDFVLYSYVSYYAHTLKVKNTCGIMCLLDLILMNDALKYGVNGTHGELETVIYQNIEYLAFYANLIIIFSLLPLGRIHDYICRLLDHVSSIKGSGSYMLFFWYNTNKTQSNNR